MRLENLRLIVVAEQHPIVSHPVVWLRLEPYFSDYWITGRQELHYQVQVTPDAHVCLKTDCFGVRCNLVWTDVLVVGVGLQYRCDFCLRLRAVIVAQHHAHRAWRAVVPPLILVPQAGEQCGWGYGH